MPAIRPAVRGAGQSTWRPAIADPARHGECPEGSCAHLAKIPLRSVISILTAAVCALAPCNQAAAQASGVTGSVTTVVKDNTGLCQITIPDGWRPAKSGVSWADGPGGNGPEGARAHVQAEKSTDSWEAQKKSLEDRSRGQTILYDDAGRLVYEFSRLNAKGYTLTAARPGKGYFCWVVIDSDAPGARARFVRDFKQIADSIKPVG
jgi:hypothetical protein